MPYYPPSGGGGSSNSAGLAGTGIFAVTWSGDITLSNGKILTAGSSVTIVTDPTAIYVNAITGASVSTPTKTPEFYAQAGSAINLNIKFERYIVAGASNSTGSSTNSIPASGQYQAVPLIITGSYDIDTIAVRITNTSASNDSLIRLGLYSNSADNIIYPFKAIATSGIIAPVLSQLCTFSTVQTLSSNTFYWLLCHVGTSTPTFRSLATACAYPFFMVDSGLGTSFSNSISVSRAFNLNLPVTCETGGSLTNAPVMLAVRRTA